MPVERKVASSAAVALVVLGGVLGACGSTGDAPSLDPNAVNFTEAERASMATLAPATLPGAPVDVTNKYGDLPAAAALGEKLFFDPGFSGVLWEGDNDGGPTALGKLGDTGKVACAGCHQPEAAFADARSLGHAVSLAAGWTLRRSPSLYDVSEAKLLMWDGRRDSLFSQVFGPIEARNEMNSSRLFVAERVFAEYRAEYESIFGALPPLDDARRFPALGPATTGCKGAGTSPKECHGMPGDGAEYDGMAEADRDAVTLVVVNFGKAVAAFERTLRCGPGRFDAFVHGDASALTAAEQRGLRVFLGKGNCVGCHSGPFFSDQKFHDVGLHAVTVATTIIDPDDQGASVGLASALADPINSKSKWSDGDDGRLPASVDPSMLGALRTPTLRCAAMRPSFMHTGQLHTLEDVVEFFAKGGDAHGFAGKNELAPLALDEGEKRDLVAFLRALDGTAPTKTTSTATK